MNNNVFVFVFVFVFEGGQWCSLSDLERIRKQRHFPIILLGDQIMFRYHCQPNNRFDFHVQLNLYVTKPPCMLDSIFVAVSVFVGILVEFRIHCSHHNSTSSLPFWPFCYMHIYQYYKYCGKNSQVGKPHSPSPSPSLGSPMSQKN